MGKPFSVISALIPIVAAGSVGSLITPLTKGGFTKFCEAAMLKLIETERFILFVNAQDVLQQITKAISKNNERCLSIENFASNVT